MARWIVVLVATNVVTLLALAVCVTLLVERSFSRTARQLGATETEADAEELAQARRLVAAYRMAKDREGNANANAGLAVTPRDTPTSSTPRPVAGPAGWRLMWVMVDSRNPEHSEATVEVVTPQGPQMKRVQVGDTLDGHEVIAIEAMRMRVRSPQGDVISVQRQVEPWPSDSTPTIMFGNRADQVPTPQPLPSTNTNAATPHTNANANAASHSNSNAPRPLDPPLAANSPSSNSNSAPGPNTPSTTKDPALPVSVHMLSGAAAFHLRRDPLKQLATLVVELALDSERGEPIGARLVGVSRGNLFGECGFKVNDVITSLNGERIATGTDLENALLRLDILRGALWTLTRNGEPMQIRWVVTPQAFDAYAKEFAAKEALLNDAQRSHNSNTFAADNRR